MLRGLNPLLTPDLLHGLAAMGHGDKVVIADANFPGTSMGNRLVRLDGISATDALTAILGILPLDDFVPDPAQVMEPVDKGAPRPQIFDEFQSIIDETADNPAAIAAVDRFAFYDIAKTAFLIVQTGELRLYGNVILSKGVIGSDA